MLKGDPLKSLENLPNLLRDNAYDGEILNFEAGGFLKLKKLILTRLNSVHSIIIGKDALLDLEYLKVKKIPKLKEVPSGIKHLENLKFINVTDMPAEFVESIDPVKGQGYCFIDHVQHVFIRHRIGTKSDDYVIRNIHSSFTASNVQVPFSLTIPCSSYQELQILTTVHLLDLCFSDIFIFILSFLSFMCSQNRIMISVHSILWCLSTKGSTHVNSGDYVLINKEVRECDK